MDTLLVHQLFQIFKLVEEIHSPPMQVHSLQLFIIHILCFHPVIEINGVLEKKAESRDMDDIIVQPAGFQ